MFQVPKMMLANGGQRVATTLVVFYPKGTYWSDLLKPFVSGIFEFPGRWFWVHSVSRAKPCRCPASWDGFSLLSGLFKVKGLRARK